MIGVTREQFNEHRKPVICLATICVVWINYQLSFVIYTIHVHKTPKTKKRVLWIEEKSREKTITHTHRYYVQKSTNDHQKRARNARYVYFETEVIVSLSWCAFCLQLLYIFRHYLSDFSSINFGAKVIR